jgi:hypothetical protein
LGSGLAGAVPLRLPPLGWESLVPKPRHGSRWMQAFLTRRQMSNFLEQWAQKHCGLLLILGLGAAVGRLSGAPLDGLVVDRADRGWGDAAPVRARGAVARSRCRGLRRAGGGGDGGGDGGVGTVGTAGAAGALATSVVTPWLGGRARLRAHNETSIEATPARGGVGRACTPAYSQRAAKQEASCCGVPASENALASVVK